MSHGLLEILKYFLLALLWLFFIYAARMVVVDIRRNRPREKPKEIARDEPREKRVRHPLRLHVVGPENHGGSIFDVAGEITLGRSSACAITLEGDSYASSVHARVYQKNGELWLEDLASTNGTFLNDERLVAPVRLRRGDFVKVGSTVFEVSR